MLVYHGSDTIVDRPLILDSSRPLDFGGGFYVTTSKEQAKNWAVKVAYRNASAYRYINRYEFHIEAAEKAVTVLRFDSADDEWLDFICANRQSKDTGTYDIVIGPVADDKVYRVVIQYENGELDRDEALKRLRVEKLCDQILFHTDKALTFLEFQNADEV